MARTTEIMLNIALAVWMLVILTLFPGGALGQQPEAVKIGVLAYRGTVELRKNWQPLADYLQERIPGKTFQIIPVSLISATELIDNRKLDFLVTNPGHFVSLSKRFGLSAIATRQRGYRQRAKSPVFLSRFGSVLFTRLDSGIETFADLKGKVMAAVSPQAFGGFQVAWHELTQQNIDPFTDLKKITFTGFPQDSIIEAVLSGRADAGTVRSGLVEQLTLEGSLDPSRIRVLRPSTHFAYPFHISSALYPEWPFVMLPGTAQQTANQVARALLATSRPDSPVRTLLRDKWTVPASYRDVRLLIDNYKHITENNAAASRPPNTMDGTMISAAFLVSAVLAGLAGFFIARVFSKHSKPATRTPTDLNSVPDHRFEALTTREKQVLCHLCRGLSSKQIADILGISPKTVEFHRANLLHKTDAGSTPNLVRLATAAQIALEP